MNANKVLGNDGKGFIAKVTVNDSWTELTTGSGVGRNAIAIQNKSGSDIYINTDNTATTANSWVLSDGSEISISIQKNVRLYATVSTGTADIIVWEQA